MTKGALNIHSHGNCCVFLGFYFPCLNMSVWKSVTWQVHVEFYKKTPHCFPKCCIIFTVPRVLEFFSLIVSFLASSFFQWQSWVIGTRNYVTCKATFTVWVYSQVPDIRLWILGIIFQILAFMFMIVIKCTVLLFVFCVFVQVCMFVHMCFFLIFLFLDQLL